MLEEKKEELTPQENDPESVSESVNVNSSEEIQKEILKETPTEISESTITKTVRKSRKRQGEEPNRTPRYVALAAGAVLVIAIATFVGKSVVGHLGGNKTSNIDTVTESETAENEDLTKSEDETKEVDAVIDSYKNLGIVQVSGYLNIRETASTDGNIIGKLSGDSACEIVDDSTEGWYQIESGGISGYISSEFVLTGDDARKKAKELVKKRAIITADSLNIRKEPNTDSEVVGQALKNERYVVEDELGDSWIQIPSGYISADYAEIKYALNEARKLDMRSMVLNLYKNLGISSVDNYLNVRDQPSEDGNIIGKMTSKSAGEILETSEDGQWYKIQSGSVTGYVKAEYILTGDAAKQEAMDVASLMAIVSTDRLNARTEPSTDAPIWTQISNNERYDVISQQDGWVEIALDTTSAYVATDYVDVRYALPEAIPFSSLKEKSSLRSQIVNYALQFVGNRYVWGGNDPHTGVDCSGFTKYVYSHVAGITLPRVSRDQARTGTKIDSSKMRPGDLIFYTNRSGTVNHVAMYIGNGQIVHAASRKSGIKISTWNYRNPYRIVNMIGD